ncbi:hypothetical protein ABZS71_20420 [Streptomyces sp. NPDC005393]|uniref:RraA family protein n=1 Tax=Streptomyces sp. NPDC005393 TaxID=3157041 RepID=UPI0033B0F636
MHDLVTPTPGRVLFGPAVTISFFPSCSVMVDPETHTFGALFQQAVGVKSDDARGKVLVLASNGHRDVSIGGGTKLSLLARYGLAGVLTDARLRDFAQLQSFRLTTFEPQLSQSCMKTALAGGTRPRGKVRETPTSSSHTSTGTRAGTMPSPFRARPCS